MIKTILLFGLSIGVAWCQPATPSPFRISRPIGGSGAELWLYAGDGTIGGLAAPAAFTSGPLIWKLPGSDAVGCVQSDGALNLSIGTCGGTNYWTRTGTTLLPTTAGDDVKSDTGFLSVNVGATGYAGANKIEVHQGTTGNHFDFYSPATNILRLSAPAGLVIPLELNVNGSPGTPKGLFGGHWLPNLDDTYDLGRTFERWRDMELSRNAIIGGNLTVLGSCSGCGGSAYWDRNAGLGYLFPLTLTDRVGIGTNTPQFPLDVVGEGRSDTGFKAVNNASGFGTGYIGGNKIEIHNALTGTFWDFRLDASNQLRLRNPSGTIIQEWNTSLPPFRSILTASLVPGGTYTLGEPFNAWNASYTNTVNTTDIVPISGAGGIVSLFGSLWPETAGRSLGAAPAIRQWDAHLRNVTIYGTCTGCGTGPWTVGGGGTTYLNNGNNVLMGFGAGSTTFKLEVVGTLRSNDHQVAGNLTFSPNNTYNIGHATLGSNPATVYANTAFTLQNGSFTTPRFSATTGQTQFFNSGGSPVASINHTSGSIWTNDGYTVGPFNTQVINGNANWIGNFISSAPLTSNLGSISSYWNGAFINTLFMKPGGFIVYPSGNLGLGAPIMYIGVRKGDNSGGCLIGISGGGIVDTTC